MSLCSGHIILQPYLPAVAISPCSFVIDRRNYDVTPQPYLPVQIKADSLATLSTDCVTVTPAKCSTQQLQTLQLLQAAQHQEPALRVLEWLLEELCLLFMESSRTFNV